jgi:hypothetical protein
VQKLERLVESGTYFLFVFWSRKRSGIRGHARKHRKRKKERKKEVHQNKKAQATFQLFYFLFLVPRLPSCSQVFTKKSDIIAYTHKKIDTGKLYTRKTKQASLLSFLYSFFGLHVFRNYPSCKFACLEIFVP